MKFKKIAILFVILFHINSCKTQTQDIKSIKDALVTYSYNDIDAAINHYKKLKNEEGDTYNFNDENELNNLGYQLISDNRFEDAIKIFELLVAEFPNSFNPYDSLGEAYYLIEDKEKALKNYQKSLELNPKNENAERFIVDIEFENRDKNKFYKIYTKQEYLDDLDELAKTLTEENPHPYKYISKDDFWLAVNEKKGLITDNTTYSEFIWHCSELVANINCGHSSLWYFNQESEMLPVELRFPLEARLIDDRFYVTDPLINTKIHKSSEILTINGKTMNDIKTEAYKHIRSQGYIETTKNIFFNSYVTAYIPYVLNFPNSYTITVKGNKKSIHLKSLTSYTPKPRYFETNLCESKTICLDFIKDDTALLTLINTAFYGNSFSTFKRFIDDSFQEIKSKGVHNLIIDMRSNGGGPGNVGIYLLQYLTKKPFVYKKVAEGSDQAHKSFEPFKNNFNGNLFFLVNGASNSTTGHIVSIIEDRELATIVGEEMGSNQFCTGGQKRFKLTNTDVFYLVGRYTNITAVNSKSDNRGIMPDYFVTQGIEDYLNDVDTVLEYTLKHLIK